MAGQSKAKAQCNPQPSGPPYGPEGAFFWALQGLRIISAKHALRIQCIVESALDAESTLARLSDRASFADVTATSSPTDSEPNPCRLGVGPGLISNCIGESFHEHVVLFKTTCELFLFKSEL